MSGEGIYSLLAPADLPVISAARARTDDRLTEVTERLARLDPDDDASVVLMGSWGRRELTSGSDDDFMLLFNGERRTDPHPARDETAGVLGVGDSKPGPDEIFGVEVWLSDLRDRLGRSDSNENLTRRRGAG